MPASLETQQPPIIDAKNGVIRVPFYLPGSVGNLFCWLHLPGDKKIADLGVLLCAPLGYEQVHSHQSYLHLADGLAASGKATIRFDFYGSSDSAGTPLSEKLIDIYLQDIDRIKHWMRENLNIKQFSLVGLRTGATIAADYCANNAVERAVFWVPCAKGRQFVREMQALEKVAGHDKKTHDNFIDSGGFVYSHEVLEHLRSLDMLKQSYQINQHCLLIERDDVPGNHKLTAHLSSQIENISSYKMHDYLSMMAEPHDSQVPEESLLKIVEFFSDLKKTNTVNIEQIAFPQRNLLHNSEHEYSVEEQIFVFQQAEKSIFSIISQPECRSDSVNPKSIIVFANSGSVHHVGPNRIYVELCRQLAAQGLHCVRMDLSNLGDSVIGKNPQENTPYPEDAVVDISHFCDFLCNEQQYENIIISGLCSGAYHSLHSSISRLEDESWNEVIMINPLTFYRDINQANGKKPSYHVEKYSNYYGRSVKDLSKWKKLFSGKVNFKHITFFALEKMLKTLRNGAKEASRKLGIGELSQLSQDLFSLANHGVHVTFFLATQDPGYEIIMASAKHTVEKMLKKNQLSIHFIDDADHTFSAYERRRQFIANYVSYVKNRPTIPD